MVTNAEKIIVALDLENRSELFPLVDELGEQLRYVKVGMQLFYAEGPELLTLLRKRNLKIFLDLKLHDIPNTVQKGVLSLARLKINMLTVHASGGQEMMRFARQAVQSLPADQRPLLIAVTQLTSTSEKMLGEELNIQEKMEDSVVRLAQLAKGSGMDGIVASGQEARRLRDVLGDSLLLITPGIRLFQPAGDQQRIVRPKEALQAGANYLVIGREITSSPDPKAAFQAILDSL